MRVLPGIASALLLASIAFAPHAHAADELTQTYQEFRQAFDAQHFQDALPAAEKVVTLIEQHSGSNHPDLVVALTDLAATRRGMKNYSAAEDAYVRAIRIAEAAEGGFSRSLIEPLVGLGRTYQAAGLHAEAIPALRRAVDISRKIDGVFGAPQLELMPPLIDSYVATDHLEEAEQEHKQALWVAAKLYGEDDVRMLPALDYMASWYEDTGRYAHALAAQRMAIEIVTRAGGQTDFRLIGPLRGYSHAAHLEYVHGLEPEETPGQPSRPITLVGETYRQPPDTRWVPAPRSEGEDALRLALKIMNANPDATSRRLRGETLVQLGDYLLLDHSFRRVESIYRDAWRELTAPDGPGPAMLSKPVRLLYRHTWPDPSQLTGSVEAGYTQHVVEVEFTVSREGKVENVRSLESNVDETDERAFIRAFKLVRFRPRFEDGQAVDSPGQRHRQLIYLRKDAKSG